MKLTGFLCIVTILMGLLIGIAQVPDNVARVHYQRPAGDYEGWMLHVWEDTTDAVTWEQGLEVTGEDDYGVYWDVNLADGAELLGILVHKGEEKDPGPDMFVDLTLTNEVWLLSGSATVYQDQPDPNNLAEGDLTLATAHWLRPDLIAWNVEVTDAMSFELHSSLGAELELTPEAVMGGETFDLSYDEAGLPEEVQAEFPHLAGYSVFRLHTDVDQAAQILKGQMAVSAVRDGAVLDATSLQIPGVLDALYPDAEKATLGLDWEANQIALWAPTAQSVNLHVFDNADVSQASEIRDLIWDPDTGIWQTDLQPDLLGKYYLFEVSVYAPSTLQLETNLVTDPYSVDLSLNSQKSRFTNLADAATKPAGWDDLNKEQLVSPTDITVYELHLRDFSVYDESVPEELRGTYLAFTEQGTNGNQHLQSLADAGLSHLHLLPTFDIATLNEDKTTWQDANTINGDLSAFAPDSDEQEAAIGAVRNADPYNWGYDPYHYNVPEGSYAVAASERVLEYRQMVQALWDMGLYVASDVVYNHTNSSGQNDTSVLDKVVPGYYHRLDAEGNVTTSTCCQNTATEHRMMRKLMVDSVVLWAKTYKIDAFRFDLMGHHMLDDMLAVRAALDDLTLAEDGVDGPHIYLYGEGWNFGEVVDGARGVNATQFNTAGTGIGTFNDRLRDAVRGGLVFDSGVDLIKNQGFTSGICYAPNDEVSQAPEAQRQTVLQQADQTRVGLAGNLADYTFINGEGETVSGADIDYNGQPTGYTENPQENIVYISKHDNQTFWDISQYKHAVDTPISERVRAHNVGMSLVMLAQGVPFFQAGDDLLRSKSFDRSSYNSGDWFNRIDWTGQDNGFGSGLPPAADNQENWQYMKPLLANPDLKPTSEDIGEATEYFKTLLRLRQSSKLFRLESAQDIQDRLSFHNTGSEQIPGLIIMSLDDRTGDDLDPDTDLLITVFNATNKRQAVETDLAGLDLVLHPLLAATGDGALVTSTYEAETGRVSVPARTTVVFSLLQE